MKIIAPDEYRQLLRGLNDKQRDIVMFHRKWCKEAVLSMSKQEKIKPYIDYFEVVLVV